MKNIKFITISAVVVLSVFIVVFGISSFFKLEKPVELTQENKSEILNDLYKNIEVTNETPRKGQIDLNPADVAAELPDINKFPVTIKNSTNTFVEIFSSPEKSGTGKDGWLNDIAKEFNQAKIKVNGKPVSVKIRNIASGTATDYIKSGKYIPDAFSPSNELWGELVKSSGVSAELVSKRLVGNVPGIVVSKKKNDELIKKYGKVNVKSVTEAMSKSEFAMGYTDPFASSTGINFLITALNSFDNKNLLSDKAIQNFENFQNNVPFTASTTLQMREAAKSGALDGFVLEYQTFINSPDLKDTYVFNSFGIRHDSPLYALGEVSKEKMEIIQKFAEFSKQDKYQNLAKKYGFNHLNNYVSDTKVIDGLNISAAQKLWKEKKNVAKPIVAVFVADVSGSMNGEPLNNLKTSLLKGQKYLGRENSIGLITYSDDVTVKLPIGKFNTNQQSKFVGAVESLQSNGGTATFDAVVVAMKMLEDEMKKNSNIQPLIFVLSDGETNKGNRLGDVTGLVKAYKIPIYTIGYNADIKALESISNINEAASINADTDDVVYKISKLFNVQL